jgi:hypothetical protein
MNKNSPWTPKKLEFDVLGVARKLVKACHSFKRKIEKIEEKIFFFI